MRLLMLLRLLSATSRPSHVWWITRRSGNTCGGGRGRRAAVKRTGAQHLRCKKPQHVDKLWPLNHIL